MDSIDITENISYNKYSKTESIRGYLLRYGNGLVLPEQPLLRPFRGQVYQCRVTYCFDIDLLDTIIRGIWFF